jgi:hypothetical protein
MLLCLYSGVPAFLENSKPVLLRLPLQLPPRRSSPHHVPSSAHARRSPPHAGPLPAPPRRAAAARVATHGAGLASNCFARAVLLLVLKLAQESLSTSFTHSTTQHCFFFLSPLDYPRWSSASAPARCRQLPPPPHTRDPVLQ